MFLISPILAGLLRKSAESWPLVENWKFGNIRVVYLIDAALLILLQVFSYIRIKRHDPTDKVLSKKSYKEALGLLWREFIPRR
jgi:hypothetical protein